MRFLIDACAGRRLAHWLRENGHDVIEADALGPDPGDAALLDVAASSGRILVTIDTDFGELIFGRGQDHAGLVRIPDVPVRQRIALLEEVIRRYQTELEERAIITLRGGRIRVSSSPRE